jgi:hypothetical protein
MVRAGIKGARVAVQPVLLFARAAHGAEQDRRLVAERRDDDSGGHQQAPKLTPHQ